MRRAALIAIACVLTGCETANAPESTFPPTDTEVVTGGFEPGSEVPIALGDGVVTLTSTTEGTRVDLGGVAESGAIHEGSCEDRGELAYELPQPTTELDAELVDLLGGRFALVAGGHCAELISPGE